MAQNISFEGGIYNGVPAVKLPKADTVGEYVQFTDISDTTAERDDVATGKVFYNAAGERCVGRVITDTFQTAEKDVNFYDYDGNRAYSYTATEFNELDELPAMPVHAGITNVKWQYTKDKITTILESDGAVHVGILVQTANNIAIMTLYQKDMTIVLFDSFDSDLDAVNSTWEGHMKRYYTLASGSPTKDSDFGYIFNYNKTRQSYSTGYSNPDIDGTVLTAYLLKTSSSSSTVYGSCLYTKEDIQIPATASTLHVKCRNGSGLNYCIGLVKSSLSSPYMIDGAIVMSVHNAGSETFSDVKDLTCDISTCVNQEYTIAINVFGKQSTSTPRVFEVLKVWID